LCCVYCSDTADKALLLHLSSSRAFLSFSPCLRCALPCCACTSCTSSWRACPAPRGLRAPLFRSPQFAFPTAACEARASPPPLQHTLLATSRSLERSVCLPFVCSSLRLSSAALCCFLRPLSAAIGALLCCYRSSPSRSHSTSSATLGLYLLMLR